MSDIARKRHEGGIKVLDESKLARSRSEYRLWRQAVYVRDNYTCLKCRKRGGNIHPHHVVNFASCIDLRYDVLNGATLCVLCHKLFHRLFGKKNNNRFQLDEFLSGERTYYQMLKESKFKALLPATASVNT